MLYEVRGLGEGTKSLKTSSDAEGSRGGCTHIRFSDENEIKLDFKSANQK